MPRASRARRVLQLGNRSLQRLGIAPLFAKLLGSGGVTTLMYHSVPNAELEPWIDPRFAHAEERFAAQMEFLKKHRNVISIEELSDALRAGQTLPAGTVTITFDDGYRDNALVAAPILESLGLPCTVYLATGYVDESRPQWIDELYSTFSFRTVHQLEVLGRRFDLSKPAALTQCYDFLGETLISAEFAARSPLIAEIKDALLPEASPPRLTLNWDEVRQLAENPLVTLGAHTHSHADLLRAGPELARREITHSIARIHEQCGITVEHFSYPYGRHSAEVRQITRDQGLSTAVATTPPGLITASSDPFCLPRVDGPVDLTTLAYVTSGAYPRLSQMLFRRS